MYCVVLDKMCDVQAHTMQSAGTIRSLDMHLPKCAEVGMLGFARQSRDIKPTTKTLNIKGQFTGTPAARGELSIAHT